MKKSGRPANFWPALVIFSLVGQIAWVVENMYFNVFIYKMFKADASQISTMVAASAVAATLTTILIGALSDKIGKRKLFICGGYILWGISIAGFALIRTDIVAPLIPATVSVSTACISMVIILDCIMTFFGSSANDACFNAWLTDATDESCRGAAEGVNAMMPLMAILVVFGGFMAFNLDLVESWTAIFLIIGAVVFVIGILGIFLIKETTSKSAENQNYFRNIIYGFYPSVIKQNRVLYGTLLAFAVFGISIQVFMPYLILYYNVSLQMDNYVLIMAPAIIIAAAVTALYGRFYDKSGFTASLIPALVSLCLGYIILFLFKNTAMVFIGSLLMMCGYLSGSAVFGAMVRDHTPLGKAGMFQGLRIVGQVLIPGIIGPIIGAAVLKNAELIHNNDGTTSFKPNENIFIAALAVIIVLAVILIPLFLSVRKKEHTNE
ncbi:MAG: MFS transporter [Clostridia bacterium]|nr:MFS transporter [Clostridia bacterium]